MSQEADNPMQTAATAAQRKKLVSVVIPVYFNAEFLEGLFSELLALEKGLGERGLGLELIFVNDGSGDNSGELLRAFKKRRPATKIITLTRNFGAMAATKTGLDFVTGDAVAAIGADLQDPPALILELADRWLAGSKFVVAARKGRRDPAATRAFASLYYRIVKWLLTPNYPEGGFSVMLFDAVALPYLRRSGSHINFNLYAFWLGFTPDLIHYERRVRTHGRSRWTFRKKLNLFIDTISGFSSMPIRVLSIFGIVVSMLSFLYGANLVVAALLGYLPVTGFATLATLICFFSGLILVMLGVIGEYIRRIFDAVIDKPEYVISEVDL